MPDDRRDFFAANAPEMPDWFNPPFDEPEPTKPDPRRVEESHKEMEHRVRKAADERNAWSRRRIENRYFRWRWYYADRMLAMEPKQNANPST